MGESSAQRASLIQQLKEEASQLGMQLNDSQAGLLLQHLDLVIEKNKVLNLTRIVDEGDAVTKHLIDSLLFYKVLYQKDLLDGAFLDIGTGAGFPGIPFGIISGREGVLLDSVGKKIKAVSEFLDQLELSSLHSASERVEEYARSHRGAFSLVMARAVAQVNVLVEYASPLLKDGGVLILSKGQISDEEFNDGLYAAEFCGFDHVSRETFELPHEAGHRELLVFRKTHTAKFKLPRKIGDAKHNPIHR